MSLPRFFISFEQKQQDLRIRDKECVNQLSRVLRMKVGEELILLDNTGMERVMRITSFSSKEILGVLVSEEQKENPVPYEITLCFGVLKAQRNEYILEKATELGVTALQPIFFERSQPFAFTENKLRRWEMIVKEASEQCELVRKPKLLQAQSLSSYLETQDFSDAKLVTFWEEETRPFAPQLFTHGQKIFLFIGPEGGITTEEIALLRTHGAETFRLGGTILRAETACVAALSGFQCFG